MPKLEQHVNDFLEGKTGISNLSQDEKWCIYMKYRHEEWASPLIEKLCQEEGIMHAEKTILKVDRNYRKFARNMAIWKNNLDRSFAMDSAWQKGKAEGIIEGEAKGELKGYNKASLNIAKKMKTKGHPIDEIIELTGLSSKAIKKL